MEQTTKPVQGRQEYRRVKYYKKEWVPSTYHDGTTSKIKVMGHYENKLAGEAFFHCWGCGYDELDNGNDGSCAGNYTVAILELDDGKVIDVVPDCVQFLVPLLTYKVECKNAENN
jgi:hypothetical protein